jgi:crotonobetainyl-CoA:carnitine CoA-transferase CaiB-like acyl-CoA transferase
MRMEGIGYKAERMQHSPDVRAPLFGEHTRDVLREWLGVEAADCEALEAAGAFN